MQNRQAFEGFGIIGDAVGDYYFFKLGLLQTLDRRAGEDGVGGGGVGESSKSRGAGGD